MDLVAYFFQFFATHDSRMVTFVTYYTSARVMQRLNGFDVY